MRSLAFVVPGDLETRTGGYGYDRRIVRGLRDLGWNVAIRTLDASFPFPTARARAGAVDVLAALPDQQLVIVDGLALGALGEEVQRERDRLRLVALVHHPLALETGLDADAVRALERSERTALDAVGLVVVTSGATARVLAMYDVPAERIVVVEPGTDRAPLADRPRGDELRLLCVAAVIARKGHVFLIDALAALSDRAWHLVCVGGLDRDHQTRDRLLSRIQEAGLTARVTFTGDLDEPALAAEYDRADVFVLPTVYEGYGMAVAEALARGLPVISTATGAIGDLVGTDAGLLVPPGDRAALAAALRSVLDDRDVRDRLAAGARQARERLPTWPASARAMAKALEKVGPAGRATFSAGWLDLREPADRRARSVAVVRTVADALPAGRAARALDLGAGTGSNARYLSTLCASSFDWTLVDRDPTLLSLATSSVAHAHGHALELGRLEEVAGLVEDVDLVTASALLDLVSAAWLDRLINACCAASASVLFALSYDGRIECSPGDPWDAAIRDLVNAHQRLDKGLGPALGPDAPAYAVSVLGRLRYAVVRERSDWLLGAADNELQRQLIEGWADAALEMSPATAVDIARWRERRLECVREGTSRLRVGHEDIGGVFRRNV